MVLCLCVKIGELKMNVLADSKDRFRLLSIFVGSVGVFSGFAVMMTLSYWVGVLLTFCGYTLITKAYTNRVEDKSNLKKTSFELIRRLQNDSGKR